MGSLPLQTIRGSTFIYFLRPLLKQECISALAGGDRLIMHKNTQVRLAHKCSIGIVFTVLVFVCALVLIIDEGMNTGFQAGEKLQ